MTTTMQLEWAAIVPPVDEIDMPPAVALAVPPHEFVRPLGVDTAAAPAGYP